MEMYQKVKIKRIQAQPTKEEIEAHMLKDQQIKSQHEEQERELAEARRKDWKLHGSRLKRKSISPTRKKLDFVEEQKLKEKEEEEARKTRLEKGKEYGDAVRIGAQLSPSPNKKQSPGEDESSILVHRLSPRGKIAEGDSVLLESPSHKKKHAIVKSHKSPQHPTSTNTGAPTIQTNNSSDTHQPPSNAVEDSDHMESNASLLELNSHPKSNPKRPNPKQIISQQSSIGAGPVESISSPYRGKVGADWVAEVMEMDQEEGTLADVYETGFSMFMVEKGIINSKDDDERAGSALNIPI
jgi:hypothetical protein